MGCAKGTRGAPGDDVSSANMAGTQGQLDGWGAWDGLLYPSSSGLSLGMMRDKDAWALLVVVSKDVRVVSSPQGQHQVLTLPWCTSIF